MKPKEINNKAMKQRSLKILLLFILLTIAIVIFLFSVLRTIQSDRRIPSHNATLHDRSFRGSIISADGYTLSSSQKTYQATVRGASIRPDKRALFIKFFSIYSGIPVKKIEEKFFDQNGKAVKGNILLSKNINARSAMQLKSLTHKLRKFDVFQWIKNSNGVEVLYGLDIMENGEARRFPKKDVLSPILGYISKKQEGRYIRPQGQKGLERHYEKPVSYTH